MSPNEPKTYTASQIGAGLSTPRSTIRRLLDGVAPDTIGQVQGQKARFYSVARLPERLRERLAEVARERGYPDVEHLLDDPQRPWEPRVPYELCSSHYQMKARLLRDALATPLERRNDPSLSRAELLALGLADYKAVCGHPISERHWFDLFYRTLERAGDSQDFSRLDLYLPERPTRRIELDDVKARAEGFVHLERTLGLCRDAGNLSEDGERHILATALESYEILVQAGQSSKAVKSHLLDLLWARTKLSASREGLRRKLDRALERWRAGDYNSVELKDGRKAVGQDRRQSIPQADMDTLTAIAVFECGGRLSQAWRTCLERRLLSEALLSRFLHNPASKSYVPAAVRNAIGPELPMLMEQHHGPRAARDNGAYLDRCWDGVPSLAWWNMDDATLPLYVYVPDGKGWFTLMRGQFLLTIDTRSTCILGYALMPERNYNARVIRTLITHVSDEHGLPTRGFYFERGIWECSRILKGVKDSDVPFTWEETERGLREFGLEFKHAIRARSKPVERVLGALQSLMEGDFGYAGRNEITAGFEHFKKQKLQVESRKLDPREHFYSVDEWDQRLGEICQQYNAEPQQGKMTGGLSPEDALQKYRDPADKPVRLDARCRYLLAHHRRPVTVTANGITLRFGKQVFNYRSELTGPMRGQTVLAWFNPEAPEVLTITDMKRENPFCVERSQSVPAMDASGDIMGQELARVEDHMGFAKTKYRILKAKHDQEFRINIVSPQTVELGQQIEAQRGAVKTRQQRQAKAQRVYGQRGAVAPAGARPEQIEAMEELNRLFQKEKE
jgi:hypothetical protein